MADDTYRFQLALDFMKCLGISHAKVEPVLTRLIQLYGNNWDLIEDENYRALADSYFEEQESKAFHQEAQLSARVTRNTARMAADTHLSSSKTCERRDIDTKSNRVHASSSLTASSSKVYECSSSSVASVARGVENTSRKRQATSPSAPANSCYRCLNFAGDEEKLVQSESNIPFKQMKQEGPSTSSVYDSDNDNGNQQHGFSTFESTPTDNCLKMRWELAVIEQPDCNENIPGKISKTERESLLPSVKQTSMCHAERDFSFMESSVVIKNEPIESTQSEMALLPRTVSTKALCLWQPNMQVPNQIDTPHAANNDESKQSKVCYTGEKHAKFLGNIMTQSVKDEIKPGEDFLPQIADAYEQKSDEGTPVQSILYDKSFVLKEKNVDMPLISAVKKELIDSETLALKEDARAPFVCNSRSKTLIKEKRACPYEELKDSNDISRGQELVPITIFNNAMDGKFTSPFHYISKSITFRNAHINFSLTQIEDNQCCTECSGDCLRGYPSSCQCAREMGGEFAYNAEGQLCKTFLEEVVADKKGVGFPSARTKYCERSWCMFDHGKPCKGHLTRKFIKECWSKCGCNMRCGNRVVQKGIRHNLQVFFTNKKKGWGVRTLEDIPAGTFVCEYVGEILTNTELYMRNKAKEGPSNYYPVLLDADWNPENVSKDDELLCLDATNYGNVARFINHRCFDANLVDVPVEIESPYHHYYHIALFTTRLVNASEELTWDYLDFEDESQSVEASQCFCESPYCRRKE